MVQLIWGVEFYIFEGLIGDHICRVYTKYVEYDFWFHDCQCHDLVDDVLTVRELHVHCRVTYVLVGDGEFTWIETCERDTENLFSNLIAYILIRGEIRQIVLDRIGELYADSGGFKDVGLQAYGPPNYVVA